MTDIEALKTVLKDEWNAWTIANPRNEKANRPINAHYENSEWLGDLCYLINLVMRHCYPNVQYSIEEMAHISANRLCLGTGVREVAGRFVQDFISQHNIPVSPMFMGTKRDEWVRVIEGMYGTVVPSKRSAIIPISPSIKSMRACKPASQPASQPVRDDSPDWELFGQMQFPSHWDEEPVYPDYEGFVAMDFSEVWVRRSQPETDETPAVEELSAEDVRHALAVIQRVLGSFNH